MHHFFNWGGTAPPPPPLFLLRCVVNLSVYGATTSIGAISSLAAVVIILVAKGYKEFVYMENKTIFFINHHVYKKCIPKLRSYTLPLVS